MRLIVSFTTTPTRINKIKPMVDSILNQTRKADMIIIHLPKIYIRDKSPLVIPNFISDNSNIIINRCKDYGPATKLVGILYDNFGLNNDDYIVTVDDDVKYQVRLLEFYEKFLKIKRFSVLGLTGFNLANGALYHVKIKNNFIQQCDVLEGYGSIIYPYIFLKKDILHQIIKLPKYILLSDDIILSNYFNKRTNLFMISIKNFNKNKNCVLSYSHGKDALKNQNGNHTTHLQNYSKAFHYLTLNNNFYMNKNKLKQNMKSYISFNRRNKHKWRKNI